MNYRPWRDPLWIGCLALYLLNRFYLKAHIDSAFLRNSLNDCLCVPFWAPVMVWGMKHVGWREEDRPPDRLEVVVLIFVFSLLFEVWLPQVGLLKRIMHADAFDVMAYVVGGFVASLFWEAWTTRAQLPHRDAVPPHVMYPQSERARD